MGTVSAAVGRSLVTQWTSLFRRAASSGCRPQARDTQTCASLTGPMVPAWSSSITSRKLALAWFWLPIWVATLVLAAASRMIRASAML